MATRQITVHPFQNHDTQEEVARRWDRLTDHITTWFHRPDMEAVEIALSASAAQFNEDTDPIWLMILGPSGSGKTSVVINCLSGLPQTVMCGDLTVHTFLSAYSGTNNPSLLHQIGSGIILFKDFTTLLSKRDDTRTELVSQFREIYDGSYSRNTGKGTPLGWVGKITMIAAATPAFERAWALKRDMGERFLQVRWARRDGREVARRARAQQGHEREIREHMKTLACQFFQGPPGIPKVVPDLTEQQAERVGAMSEMVCHMRGQVVRDSHGNREIIDVPHIEEATRISKGIGGIVRFHAALFRRAEVNADDFRIARRIAVNSVPSIRWKIIESLPPGVRLGTLDVMEVSGLTRAALEWNATELESLGVLTVDHDTRTENRYALSDHMAELWNEAFSPTV